MYKMIITDRSVQLYRDDKFILVSSYDRRDTISAIVEVIEMFIKSISDDVTKIYN